MSQALLNHVEASSLRSQVPALKPGHTVRVHQRIKEGSKERVQIFEGLVIAVGPGSGVNKTFTVRKIVDGIGVEKVFPFFAPSIEKIEITKAGKVRRAKLYFMRERTGKSARLREKAIGDVELMGPEPQVEEPEASEAPEETPEAAEAAPVVEEAQKEEAAAPAEEPEAEAKEEEKAE